MHARSPFRRASEATPSWRAHPRPGQVSIRPVVVAQGSRAVRSMGRCARLDCDWYVAALPNQCHAGEDGGPQIDGWEIEYEHCAAVGTRGDLHLVLEEGMLLIGANVKADVIGPETIVERNAYLISVHQLFSAVLSRISSIRCRLCRRRPEWQQDASGFLGK